MKTAAIDATFAVRNGRTRAVRLFQSAPLKIAKVWDLEDGVLGAMIMDASPGLLAGDCYRLNFGLEAGARLRISTQGFARVHPARELGCALETRLEIGPSAALEWFPEPLMLYAAADLRTQMTVNLARGASFVGAEIWCAGRGARGENWRFSRLRQLCFIEREGAPLWVSQLDLEPDKFEPRALGAWNDWSHSGTFWAFTATDSQTLCDDFWEIIENQTAVYAGASVLANGGVGVSMLGKRAHDLQELARALRDKARPQ